MLSARAEHAIEAAGWFPGRPHELAIALGEEPDRTGLLPDWLVNLVADLGRAGLEDEAVRVGAGAAGLGPASAHLWITPDSHPEMSVRLSTVDGMTNFFDDRSRREYDEMDDMDDMEWERPGLSLALEQQAALATAVVARVRSCTLRTAQGWAQGAGVDWPRLRRELEDNGGYCDCEVVLNIFGGDVDPSVGGTGPD